MEMQLRAAPAPGINMELPALGIKAYPYTRNPGVATYPNKSSIYERFVNDGLR